MIYLRAGELPSIRGGNGQALARAQLHQHVRIFAATPTTIARPTPAPQSGGSPLTGSASQLLAGFGG